jgi:dTDP-4-amino-4,6-dideoxygalactose transaminase
VRADPQVLRKDGVSASATASGVRFHDFGRRYAAWGDVVVDVVREVADSDEFILKSRVEELERRVCARTGTEHAVAVGSGTAALTLALSALGIGPGDEVVTPAFSFIASASAVALCGAKPVFADVDPETATVTAETLDAVLSPATRAVLPVHLFSCTAPMREIRALATRRGVAVLEDSAVAFGASIDGVPAGAHGDAAVFSFFPGKPLGGIGDAGMMVTRDAAVAALCRMARNHGQTPSARFLHHSVGVNSRMDEISAAFLLRRLEHLDDWLERRRTLAAAYNELLAPYAPEVLTPPDGFEERAVYTYVIRARRRDLLREHLLGCEVETAVYYPRPLHLQPAFAALNHRPGAFPVSERLARESVALPLYPEMSDGEVEYVADCVADFCRGPA